MTAHITLLKPHRHAGRNYPAGSTLTLPQRKAAWLIGVGVATAAPERGDEPVGASLVGGRAPRANHRRAATRSAPTEAAATAETE